MIGSFYNSRYWRECEKDRARREGFKKGQESMKTAPYDTLPLAREREEKLRAALQALLWWAEFNGDAPGEVVDIAERALEENDAARRPPKETDRV